jgi:hypothetical protein
MTQLTIKDMTNNLSALIAQRLNVSGRTLDVRVNRAKWRLPRPVRRAAGELVAARHLAQNPKLRRQLDHDATKRAYDLCYAHLQGLNKAQRRKSLFLDTAARIAFALLAVIILWVSVLHWRGFV